MSDVEKDNKGIANKEIINGPFHGGGAVLVSIDSHDGKGAGDAVGGNGGIHFWMICYSNESKIREPPGYA